MHYVRYMWNATIELGNDNSVQGRFPFNKNSGWKFRKFYVFNGTAHSGCTDPTQATARLIRAKYKRSKRQSKKKMADSMPVLLALELLDDSKIKVDEFFDDSDDVIHLSVACCFMRRHLNLVPNFLKPLFHRISLMSLRFTFEWPDRLFNYLLKTSWPQEEYQSVIHLEEHLFHLQNKS